MTSVEGGCHLGGSKTLGGGSAGGGTRGPVRVCHILRHMSRTVTCAEEDPEGLGKARWTGPRGA